jgi:magnesium chelatase family protein
MAARVTTLAFLGVEARPVEVEVQLTAGEQKFVLVGLGDKAVAESRERVRAAFAGLGDDVGIVPVQLGSDAPERGAVELPLPWEDGGAG